MSITFVNAENASIKIYRILFISSNGNSIRNMCHIQYKYTTISKQLTQSYLRFKLVIAGERSFLKQCLFGTS